MQISMIGKIGFVTATAAAALSFGGYGGGFSSTGPTNTGSQSSTAAPVTEQAKFPSALLQTAPNSTVTRSSVDFFDPMYSAMLTASTNLSQSEVSAFYIKTLTEAGFTQAAAQPGNRGNQIRFTRGNENVHVVSTRSAFYIGGPVEVSFSVVASLNASSVR